MGRRRSVLLVGGLLGMSWFFIVIVIIVVGVVCYEYLDVVCFACLVLGFMEVEGQANK